MRKFAFKLVCAVGRLIAFADHFSSQSGAKKFTNRQCYRHMLGLLLTQNSCSCNLGNKGLDVTGGIVMRIINIFSALVILLQSFIALWLSSIFYGGLMVEYGRPLGDEITFWFCFFLGPIVIGLCGYATIHFLMVYFPWGRFRIRKNFLFIVRIASVSTGLAYFIFSCVLVFAVLWASP
jgi:hypothetical protein